MNVTSLLPICFCILLACVSSSTAPAASTASDELIWRFEYDDADRLTKISDPAQRDTRIRYSFDDSKRLRKISRLYADGSSVSNEFDETGQLNRMTDGEGTVAYGYDDLGRLNRVQRHGSHIVIYTHDTLDRIKTLQVGAFYRVEYTYDFLGRLASMKTPAGVIEYEYMTGQGQKVRKLPNGVWTIWSYEPNGELRRIQHGKASNVTEKGYTLTPVADYSYQYRPDGLIEAIGEGEMPDRKFAAVVNYRYDNVGRLTNAVTTPGRNFSYSYDLVGNRVSVTSSGKQPQNCTFDWAGRVKTFDGNPCEYDPAGNLASMFVAGGLLKYRYTQDNRLAEVSGRVTYRYDGDGRLIARKTSAEETIFTPDPFPGFWQPLVMEGKQSGRTLIVWEGTTPLIVIRSGKPEYLMHDHLGSVRLVLGAQGEKIARIDYEPFGSVVDSDAGTEFAPRFAGLFWDPDAQAYLTMARAQNPFLGRWLQTDPIKLIPFGSQEAISIFSYCGNDPVNYRDLDGSRRIKEPAQRFTPDLSFDVLDKMQQNESYFRSTMFGDKQSLNAQDRSEIRRLAVERFLAEHAGYAVLGIGGYNYQGAKFDKIINRIIPTAFGSVNLDWATTLGHAEITSGISADRLYGPGKTFWNAFGWLSGKKGMPELGYMYPIPDRNAIKWLKALYNPNNALADVILPAWARNSNPQAKRIASTKRRFDLDIADEYEDRDPRAKGRPSSASGPPGGPPPPPPGGGGDYDGGGGGGSTITPSPVGGVYLGGAGQSLSDIGLLDGVAFDSNNNLVLLGKSSGLIKMPPLRLDDVVTIFRSVYLNGEGPTVTIDPNPQNPRGPFMVIEHSKATDATYVGWILYHADRLMKGYNLGKDNITKLDVNSAIPRYPEVLDAIYFGNGQGSSVQKGDDWERFWIVSSEARRFGGVRSELTLVDVPLKLRTQPMKWQNGKLVDDPVRKPSPGAVVFTNWFTTNYDTIAQEQFLTPPRESGITQPVPVFTELRRMALLTAIAEKLRDQGVPMPFWMRDYEIKVVPFEKTTPSLTNPRSNGRMTASIYGGVNLSPADSDVRTFTRASDLGKLPPEQQAAGRETFDRSVSLVEVVRKEMAAAEPLRVKTFTHNGAAHQALALPGTDTRALGPCRLDEVDLVVPIEGGEGIQLIRSYNSFFNPTGPWGKCWASDLPRLGQAQVPVYRDAQGRVTNRTDFEVLTPLNTVYARFSRVAAVLELNGSQLRVPDNSGEFLAMADAKPDFWTIPTHKLIRKDGTAWHFSTNSSGVLVATERNGFRTVYERNADGSVKRIVGTQGLRLVASIELIYDAAGRLREAKGQRESGEPVNDKNRTTTSYEYDASGMLIAVRSSQGRTSYQYDGPRLVAITYREPEKDGKKAEEMVVRRFEYNARGQLLAEVGANEATNEYRVTTNDGGSTITVTERGNSAKTDFVRYDMSLRPVEAKYADGTKASWSYPNIGGSTIVFAQADGRTIRFVESPDQRQRTVELDGKHKVVGEFDTAGRLTAVAENGRTLLRQEWLPDGRLRLAANETCAAHPEYDKDDLVAAVLLAPPGEQGQFTHFQQTKLDPAGRPRQITDHRGLQVLMDFDEAGELTAMVSKRDGKDYGFQVSRDKFRRVQDIESSWGKQRYAYDSTGVLEKLEIQKQGATASADWKAGLLQRVIQFDGGQYSFAYYNEGKQAGLPKEITTPNQLNLGYQYDPTNRLSQVTVGAVSRLILDYDDKGRLSGWRYAPPNP